MVLDIAFGLMINPGTGYVSEKAAFAIGEWVALPGKLFLTFIQMIVVPLILASIIRATKPLLELFGSIQQVSMAIVAQVMRIAPLAVFGLLAQAMIKTEPEVLTGLGI